MFSRTLVAWVEPSSYALAHPASAWSLLLFVTLLLAVLFCVVYAVGLAWRNDGASPPQVLSVRIKTGVSCAAVALGVGVAVSSGILESNQPIPRAIVLMATTLVAATGLAFSAFGARLARGLSLFSLVAFQSFRLPLELILHQWYLEGTIPVQMTYSGSNFDILSGLGALFVASVLYYRPGSRALAWVFAVVGFALLLLVIVTAIRCQPFFPAQAPLTPPLLVGYHLPYAWILPFAVGVALCAHILLFRRLLGCRPDSLFDAKSQEHG